MESCSRSVMEDAVLAAETAVFTIMSVIGKTLIFFKEFFFYRFTNMFFLIAPGQENHLWEAIRPNLDKKLCKK